MAQRITGRTLPSLIICHTWVSAYTFSEDKAEHVFEMPGWQRILKFLYPGFNGPHLRNNHQPTYRANQSTSGLPLEPHLNKTVMSKAEERMLFNYLSSSLCYFDGFCSIASEFSVCLFYNYWMTTCSTATSIRFWWLIKPLLTGNAQMNSEKPD